MKVVDDESHAAFISGLDALPEAQRIKNLRDRALMPGGRARVRLFERVGGGRPHPRLHIEFPAATDPEPPRGLFSRPPSGPSNAAGLGELVRAQLAEHRLRLAAADLDENDAPGGSPRFWRQSIRVQRLAAFFAEVREAMADWSFDDADAAARVVRELEDETFATTLEFDDADTGTYHSYGHDAPFVHYLEALLDSLPAEGSKAMATLPAQAAESVRRQRVQLGAHLDHLMRHKYAYSVIEETDIERTVGGLLIDRVSRRIVSEATHSDPLSPTHEVLRVDPGSTHDAAGEWIYRDAQGGLHRSDGSAVQVDAADVRAAPVAAEALTFQRAVGDPRLRPGLRLDWDGNGYVQPGPIEWVSWAGHCDVKAVLEQLGITLTQTPPPSVEEYRADTGHTQVYSRDLLLEMLASTLELGSMYRRLDGTGQQVRGLHLFGGSRNDSRPDRVQFAGRSEGRGFRWPLGGRRDSFVVESISWPRGSEADMGTVFFRHIPDLDATTFAPNPRYLRTVEGDYNIIDVTGARMEARIRVDEIDPESGYVRASTARTVLDLAAGASGPDDGMFFLGTHVDDAARRRLYRVYWDPANHEIVAKLFEHLQVDGVWQARARPGEDVRLPMAPGGPMTLSREMKRDNPAQFQALLDIALRQGKNICADTDKESAVWNGVVTRLSARKLASNAAAGVEHWKVDIKARFGSAELAYLVRRDARGEPTDFCPAHDDTAGSEWPDFLWHDIPDVGSKAFSRGEWVVNATMLERGIVSLGQDPSVDAGVYVRDDHIKNVFELLYCGLADVRFTVVHNNKRYGFTDRAAWEAAVERLDTLRSQLRFEG